MDKWIIIHPTHLLPNPFMTPPAHLPPLLTTFLLFLQMCPYQLAEHSFQDVVVAGASVLIPLSDRDVVQ